jgi:stage II sporulation protein R
MLKKELKIIGIAILAGILVSFLIAARMYAYAERTQADIAGNVIRFHVKAHSDLPEDQSLKNAVRDRVLHVFGDGLSAANSVEQTRQYIQMHLPEIVDCAQQVVNEWGRDYLVTAHLGPSFFPTRVYGDIVFPPGEYESLQITIGEGRGNNWWCILFPPLCFVDMTQDIPDDEKQQLMNLTTEEGYLLLTHTEQGQTIQVKFKIVEWWQNRKSPIESAESDLQLVKN